MLLRLIPNLLPLQTPFSSPLLHHIKNPNKTLHISPSKIMSWACSSCTFLNPPTQKTTCQICQTPSSQSTSTSRLTTSSSSTDKWACKACTFLNSYSRSNCEICDTRATFSALSNFEDLDPDGDLGGSSSVGSVFFPLRRCNTGKDKNPDGFHDLGLKEMVQNGGDDLGDKGFELGGSRNSVSKRKFQDLDSDNVNAIKDFVKAIKVGSAEALTGSASAENAEPRKDSGEIRILSYNLWFREDLEMHERMQAIGDLIQLHSPDVICFQEVTPNIYDILQKSLWWKKYRCSVSYDRAASEAYFCMQLAKLPVKSFSCKSFSYSAMGRELSVAEVKVSGDKSLVVATSHLESPCPGPPTWDQMFSKERVNQAKEAIKFLQNFPNVIFCGDMNWNDKLDGQFPFVEGWFDAWEKLRPGEVGWTYDTKSNKMLTGNKTLQKRLDRFVCHLPDFDVNRIDMIGTEAIPGLTHIKQKKMKNKIQELTLPVLPSDHYGLLLTITRK